MPRVLVLDGLSDEGVAVFRNADGFDVDLNVYRSMPEHGWGNPQRSWIQNALPGRAWIGKHSSLLSGHRNAEPESLIASQFIEMRDSLLLLSVRQHGLYLTCVGVLC